LTAIPAPHETLAILAPTAPTAAEEQDRLNEVINAAADAVGAAGVGR